MTVSLKPLQQQVVVITGASSGIGLATARAAAERGARVVLSARNGPALDTIVAQIKEKGGEATAIVADVARREDVERLASEAVEAYGGFDTWVNNAGVGLYGRLEQMPDEDGRRLFDVNFWGLVAGTQIAAEHLRPKGGAIINLGSVASDLAIPLQGMYAASKHAIKGFTDAFRMEIEEAGAPMSVTLIKPASIDTPFSRHARNYLDVEPTLPPPIYRPEDVADAILYAAEHGGRDYYVGGGGRLMSAVNAGLPAAVDWVAARSTHLQMAGPPTRPPAGTLSEYGQDGHERGDPRYLVRHSLYTRAQTHPLAALAVFGVALAGMALLARPAARN